MAILKNCEIWYVKANPKRPNKKMNPENPTWEVQCRTTEPAQREEWVELGFRPKLMQYKSGDNEGENILHANGKKQWRINITKHLYKRDGSNSSPVKVVNGQLDDIDPDTIGNGSIANIRVFQYKYQKKGSSEEGIASVLMSIQVTKHIIYKPKHNSEDFEMTETEVVQPPEEDEDDNLPAFEDTAAKSDEEEEPALAGDVDDDDEPATAPPERIAKAPKKKAANPEKAF